MGLGARDTLRLEAGLPLYGHELGVGKDGNEIPIYAIGQARFAVSLDDSSRDFIGRVALENQAAARKQYKEKDVSSTEVLPKVIRQVRLLDKGVAREGGDVYYQGRLVGWVTSGTMVPYWAHEMDGENAVLSDRHGQRAIALCLVEPDISVASEIEIDVRGRRLKAVIVIRNLENRKGTTTYAIV